MVNDPQMAQLAAEAAKEVSAKAEEGAAAPVITTVQNPTMVGEDFAYYLDEAPGAFLFLSSSNPAKHTDYPHHSSHFDVDEEVFWRGAAVFAAIAAERARGENGHVTVRHWYYQHFFVILLCES